MSIDKFINSGILVRQDSSKNEITDLLKIVERDLEDSAQTEISDDWQFGIAYNAALMFLFVPLATELKGKVTI